MLENPKSVIFHSKPISSLKRLPLPNTVESPNDDVKIDIFPNPTNGKNLAFIFWAKLDG